MLMNLLELKCVSSLTKVFPDTEFNEAAYLCDTVLQGEYFSFQVAYRANRMVKRLRVALDVGGLQAEPQIRSVGLCPAEMLTYGDPDDFVLRTTPGLYPDPLYPLSSQDEVYAYPKQWRSIWITINTTAAKAGQYPIHIKISGKDDTTFGQNLDWYGEQVFTLTVLPAKLQKQQIVHTEWFWADCISTWYSLKPCTPPWWDMIKAYVQNAVEHGINMLLTPVFTPPLETQVGSERLTVQLVDITKEGDGYTFDFAKLDKWLSMALECGIEYFEMPHLFTQWGAKCTPKIIVRENGQEDKMFGWEVASEDASYLNFLDQFLPALISCLERRVPTDHVYFHISDEPHTDSLERYGRLSAFVTERIGACALIDALSEYELFEQSTLTVPVTATETVDEFLDKNVENLWVYYACLQYKNSLSNRFYSMPSNRNRIIGIQLYKHNIRGFLHWGYNHWYSGLSIKKINPFLNTDADANFPSGDAYLVYPGPNGPMNSIRAEVLREAFQDQRALQMLESLVGRAETLRILEEGIPPITFQQYPHDPEWMLDVRRRINEAIAKAAHME